MTEDHIPFKIITADLVLLRNKMTAQYRDIQKVPAAMHLYSLWLNGMKRDGQWWFRLFGYGLSGKDIKKYPLIFSERYGHRKGFRALGWIFHFLIRGDFKQ